MIRTLPRWSLRIALSKLRPLTPPALARIAIVAAVVGAFLFGDYRLFLRLFQAIAKVEAATPFFALGLLRNLLSMVFLVATVVLFSSSLTAAIGAFFSDLDLDIYHAAPRPKLGIAISRWAKTMAQSATIVFGFLLPVFIAFGNHYGSPQHPLGAKFYLGASANLFLLLSIPVSMASTTIVLLVRLFPVRRVHQIVATLAMIVLTLAVVAFRMSRPERFFREISTDDVTRVLRTIELPSMNVYPSTALADFLVSSASRSAGAPLLSPRIAVMATLLFAAFVVTARSAYFTAFVRARETMAPVALGSALATRSIDRALRGLDIQTRALVGKEVRTLVRDVAQWSQLFLMVALLFIYLYNIRMLPLGGDTRATIVAYANLGMAGFVVSAICLRFAYPSISSEGRAFWLVQSAPMSYRRLLLVKVAVYAAPLTAVSVLLTAFANVILHADLVVWTFTLIGALLLAITLVCLGVGLGALAPNFNAENPLEVGLSLGGFAYMALSLMYVGAIMLLMARPIIRYLFWRTFGLSDEQRWIATAAPIVIAITLSAALIVFPLLMAERSLTRSSMN